MGRLEPFDGHEIQTAELSGEFLLKEDMEDFNRDVSIWRQLPESVLKLALGKRLFLERRILEKGGASSHETIQELVSAGLRFSLVARFYYHQNPGYRNLIKELYPISFPW